MNDGYVPTGREIVMVEIVTLFVAVLALSLHWS